jgi:sphingomyelin phosphodiesterase 2
MHDSWLDLHGEPNHNGKAVDDYTQFFGFTCNSPFNTFSRHYNNPDKTLGKRLDYIFSSNGLCCIDAQVVITGLIPGSNMSYSDHFGVLAVFDLTKTTKNTLPCYDPSYTHLSADTIHNILNQLGLEYTRAKKYANRLLYTCGLGVMLQLILYVLVVTLPTTLYHHQLAIILTTVLGNAFMNIISCLVPVCLIVGFVFGRTEQRALLQFIDEIETTFQCTTTINIH